MKKTTEVFGLLLLLQGALGIVHHFIGWFRYSVLIRHLDFLDGYEVYASIVIAVLGLALLVAADSLADAEADEPGAPDKT
jgi:hypothetical protein